MRGTSEIQEAIDKICEIIRSAQDLGPNKEQIKRLVYRRDELQRALNCLLRADEARATIHVINALSGTAFK